MRTTSFFQNIDNRNRLYFLAILTTTLFSILKGIRFPNIWSYSQFLFNYDYGFVKRAFVGAIFGGLNVPYLISYDFFFFFSLLIFCINILLLIMLIWDYVKKVDYLLMGCSLIFASSLSVVFLSHTIGYVEQLALLMTLVSLRIRDFYPKIIFVMLIMFLLLMIHEAMLVIFYPVIFMSIILSIEPVLDKNKVIALGLLSAAFVVVLMFVSVYLLTSTETYNMYINIQQQIDLPLRKDAFQVLYRSPEANYRIMQEHWSGIIRPLDFIKSLLVTLPVASLFILITVRYLKVSNENNGIMVLSVLASLSPLLLHFVGWDLHRWNSLTILTSFLMLSVVVAAKPDMPQVTISREIFLFFLLLMIFNLVTEIPLFDGYQVKRFPFFEHQQYMNNVMHGTEDFPYIPER